MGESLYVVYDQQGTFFRCRGLDDCVQFETSNKEIRIGTWVHLYERREPRVADPLLPTYVKNGKVSVKDQIIGFEKNGNDKMVITDTIHMVHRGVIGSAMNENQLKWRFVYVEYDVANDSWKVVELEKQDRDRKFTGVVISRESGYHRIFCPEFPLDFKYNYEMNFQRGFVTNNWYTFSVPEDGINLYTKDIESTNRKRNSYVDRDRIVIQMACRLKGGITSNTLRTRNMHTIIDFEQKIPDYMRKHGFSRINAFFKLCPVTPERTELVVVKAQPFMERNTNGFKFIKNIRKTRRGDNYFSDEEIEDSTNTSCSTAGNNELNLGEAFKKAVQLDPKPKHQSSSHRQPPWRPTSYELAICSATLQLESAKREVKPILEIVSNMLNVLSSEKVKDHQIDKAKKLTELLKNTCSYVPSKNLKKLADIRAESTLLNNLLGSSGTVMKQVVAFFIEDKFIDVSRAAEIIILVNRLT